MLGLYNAVLLPLRAAASLWAAWGARHGERRHEWNERRARTLPEIRPGGLWIHGASVGEARLVGLVVDAVRARNPGLPIAVSATTRTGRLGLPGSPRADATFFAPLDFRGYPDRVLDAVRPGTLVLVETELWPNLLHAAAERRVPAVLINGRLSPERMSRYRRLKRLYAPLLAGLSRVGAQTVPDAERLLELGVREPALVVTGNIKYDLRAPAVEARQLRARFGLAAERPVVAAGSTGAGEDGAVIDAFLETRRTYPDLFLILAPRHPQRADAVAREASGRGLALHRMSSGADERAGRSDGLLVDVVGELAALYVLARAAFVGGSLVPIGGHNVLEPAAAGVPVLFGPHTHHVTEPADALLAVEGAERVTNAHELATAWSRLLADGSRRERMARRAAGVIEANRGALARSVELILGCVDARLPARQA